MGSPPDFHDWPLLTQSAILMLQEAVMSFPTTTATSPGRIAMRAFISISFQGLFAIARLFEACERIGAWPQARIWNDMIRSPKPSGGNRLITLTDCTLRLRSR
eukprot:593451-Pyramimonas_sp.AAC.1